ncbi:MAG: MurR/RpiR family transcriptional regulator [Oscillospiraceae bacterium]|nr:MurR/RpiR family transcriptional regulator [Oscillospiraceae bacterium]MBQ3211502.1 MurR/RpiR family transcriptional regulator [Oscillospiraceae bacterium]
MTNISETSTMIIKIQALIKNMSKAESLVCEYITKHPKDVIHMSVSGLAKACSVSAATVIRASQKLGYESYQDLKIALAQDVVTPLEAINEAITPKDSQAEIIEKVFQSNMNALQATYNTLNSADLTLASEKILKARHIGICGLGNSHTIAMDLQHKLMRLGLNATNYHDNHMQIIGATYASDKDVFFCISHSGSSKDIVHAAEIAKKRGAYVISLSSVGNSPLTNIADLSLFTASNETQYRTMALSSRVAQMAIVDTIYTFIALKKPKAAEGFFKMEANLSSTKF